MDPIIELLWNQAPEITANEEYRKLRTALDQTLRGAMGADFADRVWDLADETCSQCCLDSFRQGLAMSVRLVWAMLA